jgi:hypothetical protein
MNDIKKLPFSFEKKLIKINYYSGFLLSDQNVYQIIYQLKFLSGHTKKKKNIEKYYIN